LNYEISRLEGEISKNHEDKEEIRLMFSKDKEEEDKVEVEDIDADLIKKFDTDASHKFV
jgi:hypothetical protein